LPELFLVDACDAVDGSVSATDQSSFRERLQTVPTSVAALPILLRT
jgi:hypothetical protein